MQIKLLSITLTAVLYCVVTPQDFKEIGSAQAGQPHNTSPSMASESKIETESAEEPDEVAIETLDIAGVMRHAMTKGLCQKVIKKKASAEEQQRLVQLFERLREVEPSKGTKSSWKKFADQLVKTSTEVAAGEPSHKALRKAANCTACHREHRPKK